MDLHERVKVVAWLGPNSPHVDGAFDVLDRCTFGKDGDHVLYGGELLASTNISWNVKEAISNQLLRLCLPNSTQVALAFSLLLRNPWFERIWMVQEAGEPDDAYETAHIVLGGQTYMHAIADGEGIAFATHPGLESRDFLIV